MPEGAMVIDESRVSTDQVAGFTFSMKKGIGRSVMAKRLTGIFERWRDSFQRRRSVSRSEGGTDNMDPAYFAAVAALAGSAIGGLTSLTASWLAQHTQVRAQQRAHDIARREDLYKDFIEEASKVYADSLEHDTADTSKLVRLYALVSRMRVLSSPAVIESANSVMRAIVETYFAPNITFRDLSEALKNNQAMDPLREFGEECREELRKFELSGRSLTRSQP